MNISLFYVQVSFVKNIEFTVNVYVFVQKRIEISLLSVSLFYFPRVLGVYVNTCKENNLFFSLHCALISDDEFVEIVGKAP